MGALARFWLDFEGRVIGRGEGELEWRLFENVANGVEHWAARVDGAFETVDTSLMGVFHGGVEATTRTEDGWLVLTRDRQRLFPVPRDAFEAYYRESGVEGGVEG